MTKEKKYREDKWNLQTACACVVRTGGKANPYQKKISHPHPGIKVLGAMDYLINHHKFNSVASNININKGRSYTTKTKPVVESIKKRKPKLED